MAIQLLIHGSPSPAARYLSWAPTPCELKLDAPQAAAVPVRVSDRASASGGRLSFYAAVPGPAANTLALTIPANGSSVRFWVGGRFGSASKADRDVSIVVTPQSGTELAVPVMVRVRKNAQALSAGERDRFLQALATLNAQGAGLFQRFRDMHVDAASDEAHGDSAFLPWHRAYLLDLERELQAIDPSVALPYWRFDRPAPRLFHRDFVGRSDQFGTVQFSANNPLQFWVTDGVPGIVRRPEFNTSTKPAQDRSSPTPVLSEADTLNLGRASGSPYARFRSPLEQDPHGHAHVSFGGSISQIGTAAKDPLFFLLHANVDRLWAKWQWMFGRLDAADATHYRPGNRIGHRPGDTMWPWNQITQPPRPATAPGGTLASSFAASAPASTPKVEEMLDWQGRRASAARLGFDYDDVPFE